MDPPENAGSLFPTLPPNINLFGSPDKEEKAADHPPSCFNIIISKCCQTKAQSFTYICLCTAPYLATPHPTLLSNAAPYLATPHPT